MIPICVNNEILTDIFVNFLGAFFGFGLSLLIYFHQIKRERSKDASTEKDNMINLLKYYRELIKKFKTTTNENLNLLSTYITKQEKTLSNPQVLPRKPSNDFVRLINVDNKGVFQAWNTIFNNSDNVKDYQKTNSAIDVLEGVVVEIHRMHKNVIERSVANLNEIKTTIELIPDKLSTTSFEVAKTLKDQRFDDPFYKFIDTNIMNYHKMISEGAHISTFMTDFIKPLLIGLHKDFAGQPNVLEIMMLCKKSRVKYNEVETDIKNMLEEYKLIPTKITAANNTLDESISKLETIQ